MLLNCTSIPKYQETQWDPNYPTATEKVNKGEQCHMQSLVLKQFEKTSINESQPIRADCSSPCWNCPVRFICLHQHQEWLLKHAFRCCQKDNLSVLFHFDHYSCDVRNKARKLQHIPWLKRKKIMDDHWENFQTLREQNSLKKSKNKAKAHNWIGRIKYVMCTKL